MNWYVYLIMLSFFTHDSFSFDSKPARDSIIKCGGRLWKIKVFFIT